MDSRQIPNAAVAVADCGGYFEVAVTNGRDRWLKVATFDTRPEAEAFALIGPA